MNTPANKKGENKNASVSNAIFGKNNNAATFQFVDNRNEAVAQRKLQQIADNSPQARQTAQILAMAGPKNVQMKKEEEELVQKKENNTGLQDNLKSGIENLSGYSMDDVKVHRNSDKPAQLNAHAYAQGTDIHLASGQEKHLPHEAWHVVQQKQGRVKPTTQLKGKVNINDDEGLEKEADVMGATLQKNATKVLTLQKRTANSSEHAVNKEVAQLKIGRADGSKDLTIGEIEVWLTNTGLWGGVNDKIKETINLMIQSDYQWMYSGMGATNLVIEAKELSKDIHYEQGLIHGDLINQRNEADFHVNPGDGSSLATDMLSIIVDVNEKMTAISRLSGRPDGRVYLRPQGAAIIKIVSQLLGEALGNKGMVAVAHEHILKRKTKEKLMSYIPFYTKKMSQEILDATIAPEHLTYMYSLIGDSGVDIRPLLVGNTFTQQEFVQNMLENSLAGRARLEKYIKTIEDGKQPVSMDIYIERSKLPSIIAKLQG